MTFLVSVVGCSRGGQGKVSKVQPYKSGRQDILSLSGKIP